MKCKICGHKTMGKNALANMGAHYRKAHPDRPKKERKPKIPSFGPMPVNIVPKSNDPGWTEYAYKDAYPFSPEQAEKIRAIVRDEVSRRMDI